jgi:hypothetical protein
MLTWRRNTLTTYTLYDSSSWQDAIPAGATYVRCRFRWGFHIDTIDQVDFALIASMLVSFGLCTTIGDGTETPPNARTASGDVAPPTQRWIYWETRAPVLQQVSAKSGVAIWRDSGSTEPTETKGQVKATSLPAGDTLNLWASWSSAFDIDSLPGYSNVLFWMGISILKNV